MVEDKSTAESVNNDETASTTGSEAPSVAPKSEDRLAETLRNIEAMNKRYAAFKNKFDDVNKDILAGLKTALCGGFKEPEEYKTQPRGMTPKEAAKILNGCKKITIMTGAGISAASGIPTFRGQDGFWKESKKYANEDNPEKICTRAFFDQNPMAVWEWHLDFIKLMVGKEANPGHDAVC